jgi:hypothetical protein
MSPVPRNLPVQADMAQMASGRPYREDRLAGSGRRLSILHEINDSGGFEYSI